MSNNLYTTSSTTVTGYVNPDSYITTTTGTSPLYVSTAGFDCTGVGNFINKVTQDIQKEMEKNIKKEMEKEDKKTKITTSLASVQIHDGDDFEEVIEHVPGKVYEFKFWDGKHIKTICQEGDEFDFDYAFYLAAAKHMWGKELTLEGVLKKADELRTIKKWVKKVTKAKKAFYKAQEEKAKEKEEKQLIKERKEKYYAKKKKRDKKAEQDLKQLIAEAIKMSKEEI